MPRPHAGMFALAMDATSAVWSMLRTSTDSRVLVMAHSIGGTNASADVLVALPAAASAFARQSAWRWTNRWKEFLKEFQRTR